MNVNDLFYSPFTTFAVWFADLQVKVPFGWCQSIRLSSFRAWVRFSNWSCRWMFSSISVWIVSCSSKLRLCRTSRASGRKIRCGLSPIPVRFQERSPNPSCDRDDQRSRPHRLKLQGRRQMFPPLWMEICQSAALKSIQYFCISDHTTEASLLASIKTGIKPITNNKCGGKTMLPTCRSKHPSST